MDNKRNLKVQVCALLSGYNAYFFSTLSDQELDSELNFLFETELKKLEQSEQDETPSTEN